MTKLSWPSKMFRSMCVVLTLMPLASLEAKVTKSVFGELPDKSKVDIYTLEEGALKARIMTYGARVVSLEVPDRTGKVADIVLGYESVAPYLADPKSYFGLHCRPLWQPHCQCHLLAGWPNVQTARQRWRQHAARWHEGL